MKCWKYFFILAGLILAPPGLAQEVDLRRKAGESLSFQHGNSLPVTNAREEVPLVSVSMFFITILQ